MKKFITTLCLMLSMLFIITSVGCNDESKSWKVPYAGGTVSSNGGFAVEVGDYVYFVNGVATSTDKNDFGKPVKGSLVRMLKTDLQNPEKATSAQVVVPKLFASTYYSAGVSIFNDYVYYASPSTEVTKKGEILNSQVVFHRTKLDGTGTKDILTCDTLSQEYSFVGVGNQVYLITVNSSSSDSSSSSTYTLSVYNANTGAKLFTRKDVDTYVLPQQEGLIVAENAAYIFYTDLIKNEEEQDKEFGAIYSYKLGEKSEKTLINGDKDKGPFGTKGYTFKTIKNANGKLYFSAYNVHSGEADLLYYFIDPTAVTMQEKCETDEEITVNEANFNAKVALEDVSCGDVALAIVSSSIYKNDNSVIYYDSKYGLISYDYQTEGTLLVASGVINTITSPTFKTIIGDYAYFADSSNFIYRIKMQDSSASAEKITPIAINNSWYPLEVVSVNNVEFLLATVTGDPHNSYVYAFETDVEAKIARENEEDLPETTADNYQSELDELVEKYFTDISNKEEDAFKALLNRRVGVLTKGDKNKTNSYMSSNYKSSTSSSK